MYKKVTTLLILMTLLALSLAACGQTNDESAQFDAVEATGDLEDAALETEMQAGEMHDLTVVAAQLGVTEVELMQALGDPSEGEPDFAAAAETLGVTEEALVSAMAAGETGETGEVLSPYTATINGVGFEIACELFAWDELPDDVVYERQPVQSFTDSEGVTHYYEAVYVSSGNLNWYQAAFLAQDAGGYLASITSADENTFVFNLVSDEKYFWSFEEDGDHYGISIGPFLGGYQPEGSEEPDGGWSWLSGEEWDYANWAVNLDDGVIDQDPRDNTQPNDSGDEEGSQPIMGFGEMNEPVATWGDYMDAVGTYGETRLPGQSYGFVIEYEVVVEDAAASSLTYPIVDTNQGLCYSNSEQIDCPAEGEPFYGQDAQYTGSTPSYSDNGDGTVTDNVTGLVWQQSADTDGDGDIDADDKLSYDAAGPYCENLTLADYDDWQLPTIKQLYSLIDFSGVDPSGYESADTSGLIPFIDTDYFDFAYGDTDARERIIDSQYASSSLYVGGDVEQLLFGVNFADGRIKGYGLSLHGQDKTFFVTCVQENDSYGINDFNDNGDGTITDDATGLMWAQDDSGADVPDGLNWAEALAYVEAQNEANYLGYSDWRLPDAKELQSILDYSRSPDTTNSAAIDPVFNATAITNEAGETDYAFYWSSTTHANWTDASGSAGAYVSFGRALGYMNSSWVDVHGAGAQRSDPKSGDPADWPTGNGPQGDAIRIYNYVRLVRSGDRSANTTDTTTTTETITADLSYSIVETGQGFCYNSAGEKIDCPAEGEAFYGQDAQFTGAAFDFSDNGDGTVTDNVTGLTWEQSPNSGPSSWPQAQEYCEALSLGGQDDWRMPSLKELFSISDFSAGWPYLDTTYFDLTVNGSISKDEQYWADNYYVGKTAEGQYDAAFGVNHATGHIKAYPALVTGPMGKYVRCVTGNEYGINQFVDNGDGTITDEATGLMWMQADSGEGLDWEAALAYADAQNEANYLGYSDWRLPNVKELQSIVDYDYAPDAQDAAYDGPALDPMFSASEITNKTGALDYPYYWSSTSARFQSGGDFYYAWYVAAGRAVDGGGNDSHGAGAVRFDVKVEGGPAGEGDERVYNYVRLVRGGDVTETPDGDPDAKDTALALEFNGGGPGEQGGQPGGEGGQPGGTPDFAAAAAQLGITEEALMEALGNASQGPPDFAAAAEALGITEAELVEALGVGAGGGQPGGGERPDKQP